ncbi:MAG: hypothetical protein V4736_13380, partial [Bdellovibrionota bacterium]
MLIYSSLFITPSTYAYTPEEGNVSAVLGPYVYKTNFENASSGVTSPYFGGVGLMAIGDINSKGSLEIAMFYMNKLYVREKDLKYLAEKTGQVHIVMGYRRWLTSYISTSLGFYSSYPIGDYSTVKNDHSSTAIIDTSARDGTTYGLELAFQYELWTQGRYAAVLDTRYARSITSKDHENS